MDVFETIEKRASIRSFKPEQITEEALDKILHAAERAPRIGSLSIVVLQNGEVIRSVSDSAKRAMLDGGGWNRSRAQTPGYNPLYGAPTVIMLCGNPRDHFEVLTTGIAMGMMVLAATGLGLGSVTVSSIRHAFTGPDGPALRRQLGLRDGEEVLLSLAVGIPDDPKAHEMKGAGPNSIRYIR